AGKKAQCVTGLQAKVAAAGGTIDPAKLAKCQGDVSTNYAKLESKPGCNTTGDAGALEAKVDSFTSDVNGELNVGAATTTTTTPTATTTTTTLLGTVLKFKTFPGTTSCGGAAFSPAAAAPTNGNIFSDTGCTTATNTLGRGCLYFGGGKAHIVPPGLIPDGA